MKRLVNLADRKEAIELLKKLYGYDEVSDDQDRSAFGEARTRSACGMVELSSDSEKVLSQK
jgi:hypothetical protein